MLLCELLCVLSVCVLFCFFKCYMSNGYTNKKTHIKEKDEYCFHVNEFILRVDICAQRRAFLYLHAFWLLAAMYVGSIAFSFAAGIGGWWNGRMER